MKLCIFTVTFISSFVCVLFGKPSLHLFSFLVILLLYVLDLCYQSASICQIPMQLGFLFGCPRTSTVRAATHCELVMLNRADLDKTLESYPLIAT